MVKIRGILYFILKTSREYDKIDNNIKHYGLWRAGKCSIQIQY